jgi:tetratricopeptide (TPR) repeat protein
VAEAEADLREAIRLKPDRYQAYLARSKLQVALQQTDEAVANLDLAIQVAVEHEGNQDVLALLYHDRARLQCTRQDWAAAIVDVDQSLRLKPSAESFELRGSLWEQQQRFQEAAAAYQAALEAAPANSGKYDRGQTFRRLGHALILLENYPPAISALGRCIAETPRVDADIYLLRGLARAKLADYPGAISDYTEALALRGDSNTYVYRGRIYQLQGAFRQALADFDEAIRLDHLNGDAYTGRGYIRAVLGQCDAAIEDAETAVRHPPQVDPNRLYWNAARTYAQALRWWDATDHWRTLEALQIRRQHQQRTAQLLRDSLERTPAGQRKEFWHNYIQPDVDGVFASIRQSPSFVALVDEYGTDSP